MPGEHPALWRQGLSTVGIILVFVSWAITFLLPADPLSNDFGSPATNIIRLLLFAAVVLCWASRAGIIPKRMYLLVLVAVLINSGLGSIAVSLSLPFYFDALGTMFISVIAGASMGTSTALLTALLTGMFVPTNMAYAPIGVLIAYLTAAAARTRAGQHGKNPSYRVICRCVLRHRLGVFHHAIALRRRQFWCPRSYRILGSHGPKPTAGTDHSGLAVRPSGQDLRPAHCMPCHPLWPLSAPGAHHLRRK